MISRLLPIAFVAVMLFLMMIAIGLVNFLNFIVIIGDKEGLR